MPRRPQQMSLGVDADRLEAVYRHPERVASLRHPFLQDAHSIPTRSLALDSYY